MESAINFTIPDNFVKELSTLIKYSKTIMDLPFKEIQELKKELLDFFKRSDVFTVLNENSGIICLNYKIENKLNLTHQYLLSTSVYHLINVTFFSPSIENRNNTPFTVFKSILDAHDEKLSLMNSTENKLGYHNDLFIKNGKFYLPKFVSLLNLYIGYNEGGKFHYVNKNNWDSFNYFFQIGKTKLFSYEAPPLIYESNFKEKNFAIKNSNFRQIPAFWEEKKERYMFFNESLNLHNEPNFINDLNSSLINNPIKVEIPQKANQVILFRNDLGFHCRDNFKNPNISKGINRMFLRAVSDESILFP
jgi:hypothetical protein